MDSLHLHYILQFSSFSAHTKIGNFIIIVIVIIIDPFTADPVKALHFAILV